VYFLSCWPEAVGICIQIGDREGQLAASGVRSRPMRPRESQKICLDGPQRTRRSFWARAAGVLLIAAIPLACLSPTLPLPPPGRPFVTAPDDSGNVHVSGVVNSRALVLVHNTRTEQIVGEATGSSGAYELTLAAQAGDELLVWQSINTVESTPTSVVVPSTTPPTSDDPPPDELGGAGP
jgi:hypothetical protein